MAAKIFSVEYYTATVEDKPGEGSRFLSWLATEEVNLLAFSACPLPTGKSQLTIYPLNTTWLAQAARKNKLRLSGPYHAFIVHGDDELGALVGMHRKLGEAKINISASNGIADGKGDYRYIMHVDSKDYDTACEVLNVEQDPEQWYDFILRIKRRFSKKEIP